MCGIAGIAGRCDENLVRRMTDLIAHRGPDAEGFHCEAAVSLGHRRLSIIDLSAGHQPMSYGGGRYWVVFNGEIYNYRELRGQLRGLGHSFSTNSDTEVLLAAYAAWGGACIDHLNGMFAFALWDREDETLFLARDPLGIKPLYFAEAGGVFHFASEIKALRICPGVDLALDTEAMDDYLTYLYTMPPRTFYRGIRQVPPGHCATWKAGRLSVRRYWHLALEVAKHRESGHSSDLGARLDSLVKSHLVADVPVGAFLSGGLDSATIVRCMADQGAAPMTFTVGFGEEGGQYDETREARQLSESIGTRHHQMEAHIDPSDAVETVLSGFDEPFGNPTALLSHAICGLVRKHVAVVLSGDGGDECFGGYPRYRGVQLMQSWRKFPFCARRLGDNLFRLLPEAHDGRYFLRRLREFSSAGLLREADAYPLWLSTFTPAQKSLLFNGDLQKALAGRDAWEPIRNWADESGESDPAARAMYVDFHAFLPNNVLQYGDRMSMAHGLEVRVPFADRGMVECMAAVPAAAKLSGGVSKKLLRECMQNRLPQDVLVRKKMGFNPPMGVWLTGGLRDLVEDTLSKESMTRRGWFNPVHVQSIWGDHVSGRRDHTWHLWALVLLEAWARR
jgi:asparagine synthase (glutamine-hydrolysing)